MAPMLDFMPQSACNWTTLETSISNLLGKMELIWSNNHDLAFEEMTFRKNLGEALSLLYAQPGTMYNPLSGLKLKYLPVFRMNLRSS